MKGFLKKNAHAVVPIEELTLQNTEFRHVYSTTQQQQLVFMALQPGEDIGLETHLFTTQFIRIEQGHGMVVLNGKKSAIKEGDSVTIPAGTEHNVINLSERTTLKLYTIYAPPIHNPGEIEEEKTV